MMKAWTTIATVLVCSSVCFSAEFEVQIAAGPTDRQFTPVFIDVDEGKAPAGTPASVICKDVILPAQIEKLEGGKSRIWWLTPELAAGEAHTCKLVVGRAHEKPADTFAWSDSSGKHGKSMDLKLGDRPLLRYMYTPFDPADVENTKKPFHHVFDPNGSRLITKGVGGLYPHHRGIFFGYNKCTVDGATCDIWHAHKGEHSVHRRLLAEIAGPVLGGHVLEIDWNDRAGKTFATETRRLVVFRQPQDRMLIEIATTLRATRGPVDLKGDPQHAGVQFRAAQAVADNKKATRYLRPAKWAHLPPDKEVNNPDHKNLPWNALQFPIGDRRYTVAYLTDPKNPDNALFSERTYGRFGEYFPYRLTKDNPLSVRYRWWIDASGKVSRERIDAKYADLATPPEVRLR